MKHRTSLTLLCLILFVAITFTIDFFFTTTLSPSIPRGIYIRTFGEIVDGTIVSFPAKPPFTHGNFLKIAHLAHPGFITVSGTHPLSYDSRYYGPIPIDTVTATYRPLITFQERKDS